MSLAVSSETDWYRIWHRLTLVPAKAVLFPAIGLLIAAPAGAVLDQHPPAWIQIPVYLFIVPALFEWTPRLVARLLPGRLPTYLYLRWSLRTPITRDEARKLSFLFDGSLNGVRYSFIYLRSVEEGRRRESLKLTANRIADQWGRFRPFGSFEERFAHYQANANAGKHQPNEPRDHTPDPEPVFEIPDSESVCASLRVLGLHTKPQSFAEIRRAYRRKINEYHPDKFARARPEIIRCADETAKNINTAYQHLEQVCQGQ